jgi:hypothetical protein
MFVRGRMSVAPEDRSADAVSASAVDQSLSSDRSAGASSFVSPVFGGCPYLLLSLFITFTRHRCFAAYWNKQCGLP